MAVVRPASDIIFAYAHIENIGSILIISVISYFLPCVPDSLIIDVIASYFRNVLKITMCFNGFIEKINRKNNLFENFGSNLVLDLVQGMLQ